MILVTTIDLDSFYSNYYFFSRKKRRRSWRIKNKARLKKISCVSLMRKLWCVHERSSSSVANGTKLWTQPWYLWVQPWVFSAACKYRSRREEFASSSLVTRKRGRAETEGILTLMRLAAMLEQGETTALRQRSCTTKLQTVTKERKKTRERLRFVI